jgi:hypothetical protein
MMKTWKAVFAVSGSGWGIPQEHITQLVLDIQAAETALNKVKGGERTPVDSVKCNVAFKNMETEARFIKKHYLLVPPLTPQDLASLLLSQEDDTYSPAKPPQGQPALTISLPGGPHMQMVHLGPLPGTEPLDKRSEYGFALRRGVMPHGGATLEQAAGIKHYLMKPPLSGDELLHYCFTRRHKELVDSDASESGMTAYYCARYENRKGWWGPWGPVVGAVIP